MKNVYLSTNVTESGQSEVLMKFKSKKVLKAAEETGAVIEKGISIFPSNILNDDDYIISTGDNHNNSNNHSKQPYIDNGAVYYPFEETEEMIEAYKLIKKLANRPKELDLRQFATMSEKIKFIYDNIFYQRVYPDSPLIPRSKKICFVLWMICGILNTMEGKTLLYPLNYLCAVLQIDDITLAKIIMSSSISEEKKNYIFNSLKAYGITNPEAIDGDNNITFYTKFEKLSDLPKMKLR